MDELMYLTLFPALQHICLMTTLAVPDFLPILVDSGVLHVGAIEEPMQESVVAKSSVKDLVGLNDWAGSFLQWYENCSDLIHDIQTSPI